MRSNADTWVADTSDLPSPEQLFIPVDDAGRPWVALQRYASWHRDNALRRGPTMRERDVFFLQFSWLTPAGQGRPLLELLEQARLAGRWMSDPSQTHQQYLGELAWSPVGRTAPAQNDVPERLHAASLEARPAVNGYLWEGGTHDCSIDESVDFHTPTAELLGPAQWVPYQAAWAVDGKAVCRAIQVQEEGRMQSVLVADLDWLTTRLRTLDADLIVGTLSEKTASAGTEGDDEQSPIWSDITYVALLDGEGLEMRGPSLRIRRKDDGQPPSD